MTIEINYYPRLIGILFYLFNKKKRKGWKSVQFMVDVPERWNKLSKTQLMAIARAQLMKKAHVQQRCIAKAFLNLPVHVFSDLTEEDFTLINAKISELLEDNTLNRVLLSKVRVGLSQWLGHSDGGSNLSFLEYIRADEYYARYLKTKDVKWLNYLVATLYRKADKIMHEKHPDYKGDLREPFNEYQVPQKAKQARWIPLYKRTAILLQYIGLRNWLANKYELTFKGSDKPASKFGMNGLLVDLAGEKFGSTDDVAGKPMHEIFIFLEKSLEADAKTNGT